MLVGRKEFVDFPGSRLSDKKNQFTKHLHVPTVHQEPAYKFQIWKIFLFFIRSCTDHKLNVNVSINSESNIRFKRTASCFSKPAAKTYVCCDLLRQ